MKKLTLQKATCGYGKKEILPQVSLSINAGDLCLIKGENGSGKTTLGLSLLGLLPLIKGERKSTFKNAAYVPQANQLDKQYPIQIQTLVAMGRGSYSQLNFIKSIFHRKTYKEQLYAILKHFNLYEKRHHRFREASGGELQRALIARAIISNPDVILLDEPFANIDQNGRNMIKEILKEEHKKNKTTLVIIDHHNNIDFYTKKIHVSEGEVQIHESD